MMASGKDIRIDTVIARPTEDQTQMFLAANGEPAQVSYGRSQKPPLKIVI